MVRRELFRPGELMAGMLTGQPRVLDNGDILQLLVEKWENYVSIPSITTRQIRASAERGQKTKINIVYLKTFGILRISSEK